MKYQTPSDWDPADLRRATENPTVRTQAIPKKLNFGSDYAFTTDHPLLPTVGGHLAFTLARGGFTNVWGGALLPLAADDLADWPLAPGSLDPHYATVLSMLPLSAEEDSIARVFPVHRADGRPVPLGRLGESLVADFQRAGEKLADRGLLGGRPRLAVAAEATDHTPGCDGCGLCLTGCPRDAIHRSVHTVRRLVREDGLTYVPGVVAAAVTEDADSSTLDFRRGPEGTDESASFSRIFLACGPVNSTRIVLNSLQVYDTPVTLQESQKFILPFLRAAGSTRLFDAPEFALPSALLVLRPPGAARWSQVQMSIPGDLVFQSLGIDPARLSRVARAGVAALLSRVVIGWGSMHSDQSARLVLTLRRRDGAVPVLEQSDQSNPAFRPAVWSVVRHLARHGWALRTFPLFPAIRFAPPGHGNHVGGSLPMRREPKGRLETDLFGRPGGRKRLHVVDASVFPAVPGTTVALTGMANAYRIASETPLD